MEVSKIDLAMPSHTPKAEIYRVEGTEVSARTDSLAIEEPLEIRLAFGPRSGRLRKSISITMRTPGQDFELAVGFLFTEGILRKREDLESISYCGPQEAQQKNVVRAELKTDSNVDLKSLERHFYTSSSCGVCGKTSIEALRTSSSFQNSTGGPTVSPQTIHQLPQRMREAQGLFNSTGGIHACALFSQGGELLLAREDVGRHNALDKLIGHYFLNSRLPLDRHILLVSGRASFELIQKASMAGLRFFAAVGAPSSLAVELAKETDMTLLGFVRESRFNIYNGIARVQL